MRSFLVGLAIGLVLVVAGGIWHIIDRGRAVDEGRAIERVAWTQAELAAEQKAAEDQKAAQKAIAEIEARYLADRAADDVKQSELKKALAHEKADLGRCTALSRELRDKLNPIGRR